MILRRIGNKSAIANDIICHFPPHKIFYEPFFGAGGMFFNKPKANYSILNDLDGDVINLFNVVKDNYEEFYNLFQSTPIHEDLFYQFLKVKETDNVKKALAFLYVSAFSYLGKNDTFLLLHSHCSYKEKLSELISKCNSHFKNAIFRNKDFREFFDGIICDDKHIGKSDRFIYADPPYLGCTDNYNTPKWTKSDVVDLFDVLIKTEIPFAMSEFDNEFVLDEAAVRNLNVIYIGERRNIKEALKY